MSSCHLESDDKSRLPPNEPSQQLAHPIGQRENEEGDRETEDEVEEESDETTDEQNDEKNDDTSDNENDLPFRRILPRQPRNHSPTPPPLEKAQQLIDAIAEHERLLALADWSANTYDHYHGEFHASQLQIFDLRAPSNPTGLTIAARADVERGYSGMKSYWSICMEAERQRWGNTRKEIKAIRVKVDELKREVAADKEISRRKSEEEMEADEDFIWRGGVLMLLG